VRQRLLVVIAVVAAAAAGVFAALYFWAEPERKVVVVKPCGERVFGHISSLVRAGDRYELRFDPAFFTSGITANTAAGEDGVIELGDAVPNDYYTVDESDRLLTYYVGPNAHVTVLTRQGDPVNFGATPISVAELVKVVSGTSKLDLSEQLDSGVWIRYSVDTVCSLDQQYRP
jgi:hypothetical protein